MSQSYRTPIYPNLGGILPYPLICSSSSFPHWSTWHCHLPVNGKVKKFWSQTWLQFSPPPTSRLRGNLNIYVKNLTISSYLHCKNPRHPLPNLYWFFLFHFQCPYSTFQTISPTNPFHLNVSLLCSKFLKDFSSHIKTVLRFRVPQDLLPAHSVNISTISL